MTNHQFNCLKCHLKFSFESEEADIKKAVKDIPARCPKCLDIWGEKGSKIEHIFIPPSMTRNLDIRRKANAEATHYAKMQATAYAATQPPPEPTVAVYDPEVKRTEEVPVKVVEEVKEKILTNPKF